AGEEFRTLSGDPMVVRYEPSVDWSELPESFRGRLEERKADELVRRTTLVGPHRDDLRLVVQDLVARGFASHGEAWGAALCLRLGLATAVRDEVGESPVLFLDDPFSALDPERRGRVGRTLPGRGPVGGATSWGTGWPGSANRWGWRTARCWCGPRPRRGPRRSGSSRRRFGPGPRGSSGRARWRRFGSRSTPDRSTRDGAEGGEIG